MITLAAIKDCAPLHAVGTDRNLADTRGHVEDGVRSVAGATVVVGEVSLVDGTHGDADVACEVVPLPSGTVAINGLADLERRIPPAVV